MWEYISNREENITSTEISMLTGINNKVIKRIIKRAKRKIIVVKMKEDLLKKVKLPYCSICGKAFNIKQIKENEFICKNNKHIKKEKYIKIEKKLNAPIAHILKVAPTVFNNLTDIKSLGFNTNKEVRKAFKEVLGITTKKLIAYSGCRVPACNKKKKY